MLGRAGEQRGDERARVAVRLVRVQDGAGDPGESAGSSARASAALSMPGTPPRS